MTPAARILIFARYPAPGHTKTRLIPALGATGAARLYRRVCEQVVGAARRARAGKDLQITVCYTGARRRDFRAWLGADLHYASQGSGDIGARMRRGFKSAFQAGAKKVLLVGTDLPNLTPEILCQAMESLHDHDIVLGPAADGGYYLIGMKSLQPWLFEDIDWGTGQVRAQTCRRIGRFGLDFANLPVLNDLDRPEDLSGVRSDPRFINAFSQKPSVSVIIPTLNEADGIESLIHRLQKAKGVEVIVADGGSRDRTGAIAVRAGAKVISVPGGRAAQQNAGAAAAKGPILLFLHADTVPPDGYADMIRRALDAPPIVAGAFRFKTDVSGRAMGLVERVVNLRSALFQLPYGDQGIFLEKRIFAEMGGFAAMPIMEDFELIRRLRRRGRILTLGEPAVTSARRWLRLGVVRTTVINQIMVGGFLTGVPLARLNRFYRCNRFIRRGLQIKKNTGRSKNEDELTILRDQGS